MEIDPAEVERIARLARLSLTPEEVERYRTDLESILEYVARVKSEREDADPGQPDADRPDPETRGALREDLVVPGLSREEALRNAPDTDGVFFKVPPVLPAEES